MPRTDRPELGELEGRNVTRTTIAVTRAGDGLSEAMRTDPQLLHQGDTVYVVLECEVDKVRFDRILSKGEDTGDIERVHVLKAGTATIVDAGLVQDVIAEQHERNELHREQEAGVMRLDAEAADRRANLRGDHVLDEHAAAPVDDCPLCEQEAVEGKA